jgi:hypothetical protein
MRFLLAGTLMAITLCAHAQVDRQLYAPAGLREAAAAKPKSASAAYELDPAAPRLRINAVWTRQTRTPGSDLAPLLAAWNPAGKRADLDKSVEIALYHHGASAWALLTDPALIDRLASVTPGLPGNLFVQRIGFALGRPVFVVADMQFGAETLASARFASGQASFVYAGKRYVLPAEPAPNAQRPPFSEYRRLSGEHSGPFESVSLGFESGSTSLTLSMIVPRGPGDYPAGDGAGNATVSLDVSLLERGVLVHVAGNQFAGCTLKLPHLGATRVQGRVDCPHRLPSGLSDLAFDLVP